MDTPSSLGPKVTWKSQNVANPSLGIQLHPCIDGAQWCPKNYRGRGRLPLCRGTWAAGSLQSFSTTFLSILPAFSNSLPSCLCRNLITWQIVKYDQGVPSQWRAKAECRACWHLCLLTSSWLHRFSWSPRNMTPVMTIYFFVALSQF